MIFFIYNYKLLLLTLILTININN